MKIDILERSGYKVAQRLERILNEKLEKLEKYFDDEVNVKVVCSKLAKQEKLEITVTSKGVLYRAEVVGENMYNNIDFALPKLEKQIVRNNEKKKEKKAKGSKQENFLPFEFIEEKPEALPSVYKKKTFELDPMLVDDARFAIERLGHDFFVFLNAETGKVNILYRRKDGKFGLIDLVY
ncbi:MAG: ribosome-associated translation inhibitor RaiA [Clostridiales bacterium]|nr:ribosome-associated translation inhibitor RaiA [Clostridiales bacterium]